MQVESIIMMKSLIHVSFIVFSKNKDVVLLIVEKKRKKKIQKNHKKPQLNQTKDIVIF